MGLKKCPSDAYLEVLAEPIDLTDHSGISVSDILLISHTMVCYKYAVSDAGKVKIPQNYLARICDSGWS